MKSALFRKDRFRIMLILVLADIISIACSFFLALWMRHEFRFSEIDAKYMETYAKTIGIWIAVSIVVFILVKLYNTILSFAGQEDLFRIVIAYGILAVVGLALVFIFKVDMPRSYFVLGWMFSFVSTVVLRFARRILLSLTTLISKRHIDVLQIERIMIIGAGYAGRMLLREFIESDKLIGRVVCFIDDNPGNSMDLS